MPIKGGRHIVQVLCYLALLIVTEENGNASWIYDFLLGFSICY